LYIGTGEYLKQTFDIKDLNKHNHYVIEATWEGIDIRNISEIIAHTDYLWVSRSIFSEDKIKRVIAKALSYRWKTYDYIFHFYSETSVVCSELVLKSYLPESEVDQGLHISLEHIAGSLTFPPNNFVWLLQEESLKKVPLIQPVFFIDSIEKTGENYISKPEQLLETGVRSRWSFFQK
jgi:hypothetical protein